MKKLVYGPKTSVIGAVQECEKGFYWVVEISVPDHEEGCVSIDSSKSGYFKTKEEAQKDLDKHGQNIVTLVADEWTRKGAAFCDIIDRTKEN